MQQNNLQIPHGPITYALTWQLCLHTAGHVTYENDFSDDGSLLLNKSPKRRLSLVWVATRMTRCDYSLLPHLWHTALPTPQLHPSHHYPLTLTLPCVLVLLYSYHLSPLIHFALTHPPFSCHYTQLQHYSIYSNTLNIALTHDDNLTILVWRKLEYSLDHLQGIVLPW